MITVRKAEERGHADHGWLKSYHTFSFADYFDRKHMSFGHLRVINEDWVAPEKGFGLHPHKDMEIVTFVIEGAVQHEDSMGNSEVLRAGEVQRMTAGSGVFHSEMNPSANETLHLLQIWILPTERGLTPGYEQRSFKNSDEATLLVSPDGRDGSLSIHQQVEIYRLALPAGKSWKHEGDSQEKIWFQLVTGSAKIGEHTVTGGDGVAVSNERSVSVASKTVSEIIAFVMRE